MSEQTLATGRVLQVSISPGGVPKLPVDRARVGRLGLDGDRHRADTVHGGPHRAVALFAIEAINRVAADGHPIFPGSAGENLTTEGLELAALPVGTRLAVGREVMLEISAPDNPCDTIRGSFADGRSGRISILTHPSDTRMYARTLHEGEVRPGDEIRVLPPAPDSRAEVHALLDRIESVERSADVALWRAAAATGRDVRIVDDAELALVAAPGLPGPAFNTAIGLRTLPNLVPRVLDFFRAAGTAGWVTAPADEPPWPGAEPDEHFGVFLADPERLAPPPVIDDLRVRDLGREEAGAWAEVLATSLGPNPDLAACWRELAPDLARHGERMILAELGGRAVASASVFPRRRVGVLRTATVLPDARGRGIQRVLIAGRAEIAVRHGARQLTATAVRGSPSERNLLAMGFERVFDRARFRFDPSAHRTMAT